MPQYSNIEEKIVNLNWINLMKEEHSQDILSNYTGSYFYVYEVGKTYYLFLIDAPFEFTNEEITISFPEAGLYVMCNPDESAHYHNFTFEMPKVKINSNYKQYFLPQPSVGKGTHILTADDDGNIYWEMRF